jgi:acyl-CoA thioester hydrolase
MHTPLLPLEDFPARTFDKLRYNDTDRQGHVNNAVFATFLESGRVEIVVNADFPVLRAGASFVIAAMELHFLREINWPGRVEIGSGVRKIGNSSVTFYQQLFQDGQCVAWAETVIVQTDDETRRSTPLTEAGKKNLARWVLPEVNT